MLYVVLNLTYNQGLVSLGKPSPKWEFETRIDRLMHQRVNKDVDSLRRILP